MTWEAYCNKVLLVSKRLIFTKMKPYFPNPKLYTSINTFDLQHLDHGLPKEATVDESAVMADRVLRRAVSTDNDDLLLEQPADPSKAPADGRCHFWRPPREIRDMIFEGVYAKRIIFCRTQIG